MGFGHVWAFFSLVVFGQIKPEKIGGFWAYPTRKHRLFDILDRKESFLDNNSQL